MGDSLFGERYELSFLSTRCEVWKYNYSCLHRRKWKHRAGLCEASQQSQGQSDVKFQHWRLAELALPLPGHRKWHAGGRLCGKMGTGGLERWLEQGENIQALQMVCVGFCISSVVDATCYLGWARGLVFSLQSSDVGSVEMRKAPFLLL